MPELPHDIPAIGARIARYRTMNGMTGAEMVAAVGSERLTRSVLAKIEATAEGTTPRQDIGVGILDSIAWTLGVPPSALLLPIDRPDLPVSIGDKVLKVSQVLGWMGGLSTFEDKPTPAGEHVQTVRNALDMLQGFERMLNRLLAGEMPGIPMTQIPSLENQIRTYKSLLERLDVKFGQPEGDKLHHRV